MAKAAVFTITCSVIKALLGMLARLPWGRGDMQGWTGMYTLAVPSLSAKLIKNSHQNLPI